MEIEGRGTEEEHSGTANVQSNEHQDGKVDSVEDNVQGEDTERKSEEEDKMKQAKDDQTEKTAENTDDSTEKTAEHTKETSVEDDQTGSQEEDTEKTEESTDQEKTLEDKDKTDETGDTSENKDEDKTQESKDNAGEEDDKIGKTEESTESDKSRVEEDMSDRPEGGTEKTSAEQDAEQTDENADENAKKTGVEDDSTKDTEESTEKTTAEDDETEQTDENSERREMLSKGIADLQERRAALIEKHLKDGVQESLKFGSADNHIGTMLSGQMSVMFIINNLRTAVESRSRRKEQLKKKQAKLESQVGELRTVLDDKDRLIKEKEENLQKIQAEAEESKDGDSQTDFDQSLESVDPTSEEHAQIEALKSDIEDKKLQRALLYEQAACMASDKSWKEHEVEFLDSLLNAIKENPEEKEMKGKKKSVMAWTLLNEYRKAEHELDVLKYKDHVLEKENEELERELAFLRKIGTGEDFDDESSESDGEEEEEEDNDRRQLRDSIDDVIEAVKEAQTQTEEDSGRGSTNELWHHGANEGRKKQLPPLRKKPQKPVWRY